jgi:tetratricopeptide (TPR) repeat protein
MKSVDELWGLLREARRMPYGSAQIALVEQVLRHSDAVADRELSYAARMEATTAYVYGGEVAKSFVTFSWCLSDFDRDPAPFHQGYAHNLLWYFKYMVNALTKFPEVPLDRTYAVLDDMQRRYAEGGHSLQAVYKHRYLVARHVGDETAADSWYDKWLTANRDSLSDCAGCDPSSQVSFLSDRDRFDEAIALAEPVLAGRLTCSEQPQGILRGLLVPYLRTGRLDEAADAHRRAYRLVRGNLADLWDIGDHIAFCARTGNEHRGLEILQRHIDWLDRAPSPAAGMAFAAGGALLLRRLTELGHGDLTVRRTEAGDVPVSVLAEELATYATDLSLRFDARNGTTAQSTRIAEVLAARPYDVVVPLSPTARRSAAAAPPPPVVAVPQAPAVPADADPAVLLELAEEAELADRPFEALVAAFDARYGDADLGPAIAARRADLLATERWGAQDLAGALAAQERAAELFARAGDTVLASDASASLGVMRVMAGDVDAGRRLVEENIAVQAAHGDRRRHMSALNRRALVHLQADEFDAALTAQDLADEVAAGLADPRVTARQAMRRAFLLLSADRTEEAAEAARLARDFYREHGSPELFAASSVTYARAADDLETAAEAFGEAAAVRDPQSVLDALVGRSRALMQLERPAEAVHDLVEAVAVCAERELDGPGAFIRHELAIAYRHAGRIVEAAEVAEEAVRTFDRLGHVDEADNTRFLLTGLYRQIGDVDAALTLLDELVERLQSVGNDAGRGQMHENAAEILYRADRDAVAAERFAVAADAYRAAGMPLDELRVLRRRVSSLRWAQDLPAGEEAVRLAVSRHDELPAEDAGHSPAVWERAMLAGEAARLFMAVGRYAEGLEQVQGHPEPLRAIGAVDDADELDGVLGEALLRSGRPERAEALLRRTLAGMKPDAPTRGLALQVLADALDELGREAEAEAVRAELD